MTMDALKFVFLLCFWSFTGVTSTDSPVTLYGLRNCSVCLHVRKTPSHTIGNWMFGEIAIIDGNKINPNYTGRVTFSPKNLTLCINQLRVEDAGIFKFSYMLNFIRTSESYQVIVEDIVPRPVMTLTPENPSNISMGFCNFTVNCSIQHVWLSSNCNKDGCTTTQRSLKNLNISIHTDNSTVTCSGNNHVSTNNISEKITAICVLKSNLEQKKELRTASSISILIIIFIVLTSVLLCALFVFLFRKLQPKHNQEATAVAQLIQSGPLETQPQSEVRDSTTSSEAEPSYENVAATPPGENGISRDELVFSESLMVDTVYSVPRKVNSVKSDKKSEALGDGSTQTTSGSVNLNIEQSLQQTETVYSVLEMPKNLKS